MGPGEVTDGEDRAFGRTALGCVDGFEVGGLHGCGAPDPVSSPVVARFQEMVGEKLDARCLEHGPLEIVDPQPHGRFLKHLGDVWGDRFEPVDQAWKKEDREEHSGGSCHGSAVETSLAGNLFSREKML